MGENFQDFEADIPWKVSLKILNLADYDSFTDLFAVCLQTVSQFIIVKLLLFCMHTANLKFGI